MGVTEDNDTLKAKGPTVMSGAERAEVVRACKYVDQVIEDCPPVLLPQFLEDHQIDYFAHSDEALPDGFADPYDFVKKKGKSLVIPRTTGVSSTGIVTRILRDREKYIERQLRRGLSLEELNLG